MKKSRSTDLRFSRNRRDEARIQRSCEIESPEGSGPNAGSDIDLETSLKMSAAAAVALQELERLRSSGGSLAGEKFNTALRRIAQENFRPLGCDLIVRRADGLTRLLIRAQANGETCDLITHFFHHEESRPAEDLEQSRGLRYPRNAAQSANRNSAQPFRANAERYEGGAANIH